MFNTYTKVPVKAKLFEKGDEDGFTSPKGYTYLDRIRDDRDGTPVDLVPYILTHEGYKNRGEFGKFYIVITKDGQKSLKKKEVFETEYQRTNAPYSTD